ncbi:hypothetical protein F4677DRAFT_463727 [Hypoxylon crocopeplum]|nr:hypothetical protein F4677DRAFT_463727 [Hypoxylon crocopeplum]
MIFLSCWYDWPTATPSASKVVVGACKRDHDLHLHLLFNLDDLQPLTSRSHDKRLVTILRLPSSPAVTNFNEDVHSSPSQTIRYYISTDHDYYYSPLLSDKMVFLNLLTFGLWGKLGRLTHYAVDAVLISTILAGMRRSTGLTLNTERISVGGDNKEANKWIEKYLGVGEWVMDQSVAIAGSSGWFQRTR